MRKLVLSIVAVLVVAGAAAAGWHFWTRLQRESRYDAWRAELQSPAEPDAPADPAADGAKQARRAEIVAALRQELKDDPGRTHASELLADALVMSNKVSDAKVVLDAAAKNDPDAVGVRRQLAKICRALGLIDEAIRALADAQARSQGTEHSRVELELARIYQERFRGSSKDEDFRAARNGFQNARNDPATEAEALDGYGALWLENGRYRDLEKALATFRELLKKHPDYPRAAPIRELVDALSKSDG